jgi:hypothetical protein
VPGHRLLDALVEPGFYRVGHGVEEGIQHLTFLGGKRIEDEVGELVETRRDRADPDP